MRHAIRESTVESYLCKRVAEEGGIAYKWASPSHRGVPDRIVFLNNECRLVEVKAPGKKPTALQDHTHKKLRKLGFKVFVVDCHKAVDEAVAYWTAGSMS